MSLNAPHHPDKLAGTQWTAVDPEESRRHWQVVERRGDQAFLRAVLDGATCELPWRDLRDRARWTPGWH